MPLPRPPEGKITIGLMRLSNDPGDEQRDIMTKSKRLPGRIGDRQ
ncbi:MAG: hypothetical protein WCC84_01040 [Candidatus Cybelea sp.]